jgi:Domain of unknown function (DUF4440)
VASSHSVERTLQRPFAPFAPPLMSNVRQLNRGNMHPDPLTKLPELERDWMNAWITKDRVTCEEILDAEFLLSSARGVLIRKAEWLAGAMSAFRCEEFEWKEVLVRPFESVALVHSTIRQVASVAGQDWSGVFMLTDAWVLRGNHWKVVSRHGTGPLPSAVA